MLRTIIYVLQQQWGNKTACTNIFIEKKHRWWVLVPFTQFKKRKKQTGGVLLLIKLLK